MLLYARGEGLARSQVNSKMASPTWTSLLGRVGRGGVNRRFVRRYMSAHATTAMEATAVNSSSRLVRSVPANEAWMPASERRVADQVGGELRALRGRRMVSEVSSTATSSQVATSPWATAPDHHSEASGDGLVGDLESSDACSALVVTGGRQDGAHLVEATAHSARTIAGVVREPRLVCCCRAQGRRPRVAGAARRATPVRVG